MTKKILITGAGGFVGSNLHCTLSSKYKVVAARRTDLDLLDRDAVKNYLKNEKFDIVVHTATYDAAPEFSTNDPDKVLEYNLRMFDNIAQCEDDYQAMLYFGSGAEWKREKPYGMSKYAMDQITQNKKNIFNLRLYSVYGPGTDWRYRFINNACAKISLGLPINIPRIGKCDYFHINDLCKVVEYYIENFESLPKNPDICSGDVFSAEDIVEHIKTIESIPKVLYHDKVSETVSRAKSSTESYYGDPMFIKSLPIELTPISLGVSQLIEFYKKQPPSVSEFVY